MNIFPWLLGLHVSTVFPTFWKQGDFLILLIKFFFYKKSSLLPFEPPIPFKSHSTVPFTQKTTVIHYILRECPRGQMVGSITRWKFCWQKSPRQMNSCRTCGDEWTSSSSAQVLLLHSMKIGQLSVLSTLRPQKPAKLFRMYGFRSMKEKEY